MKNPTPKQFLLLNDEPIIYRTIKAFQKTYADIEIVVVIAEDQEQEWKNLQEFFGIDAKTVIGGKERFHSIQNALQVCTGDLIAVHDAVRPLVAKSVIKTCFESAEVSGAAIPVLPIKSSLRKITFDESEGVDRSIYREVQTPQAFKASIIKLAYEQTFRDTFTDDASVVEACGHDVILVPGNEENIKITTPFDLKFAASLSK